MKKPRSNRPAPRSGESPPRPARVLLFPCLVQLPHRHAPRPAGGEAAAEGDRLELVFENGDPGDAAWSRARSGR